MTILYAISDISIQVDTPRPCQVKQAHELVLGKTYASQVKKFLTISDAPHLDTKALIQKRDEVAKAVDLDVLTILAEQIKDPVLGTVRSWIRENTVPISNHQRSNSLRASFDYATNSTHFLFEEERLLLCYNEPLDKLKEENLRICLPISLFFACLRLRH